MQPGSGVQNFLWSVRRELWENRFIYIAPAAACAVVLAGFVIGAAIGAHATDWQNADPSTHVTSLQRSLHVAAFVAVLTSVIAGVVYCLGALHNERRDRSILFWKSLPVSDTTTVLSKAAMAMVVLPAVTAAAAIATHLAMLLVGSAILLLHGVNPLPVLAALQLPSLELALVIGLAVMALWYAPVYAWLMLVSAWARRAVFLWALLPPLGLCVLEAIIASTTNGFRLLADRLGAGLPAGFAGTTIHADATLLLSAPAALLQRPGMWWGLLIAAGLFAGAVWMRRNREPI